MQDDPSYDYLKQSAESRGLKVETLDANHFDFSQRLHLTGKDGLYRIASGYASSLLEKLLINSEVITLYRNFTDCMARRDYFVGSALFHEKCGLPIIRTVFSITTDTALLKKYVRALNGFPIIVKAIGGAHGIGVMKIDSFESLISVCDYLSKQNGKYILRKFLHYKEHARLIVLGNKVVSSIEYVRLKDDFRSNRGDDLSISVKKFGSKVEKLAVKAANVLGYEFAGVDILIDQDDQPYIAEVNMPCYFPRAQEFSETDISGAIVDHMILKSKKMKPRKRILSFFSSFV